MRPPLTPGLLLAVALAGCIPGEQEKGLWGATPGVNPADESGSTAKEEASSSTPGTTGDSRYTPDVAHPTCTGAAATSRRAATVWDTGVPDCGSAQPAGCRGKIDRQFAIRAGGNMQLY